MNKSCDEENNALRAENASIRTQLKALHDHCKSERQSFSARVQVYETEKQSSSRLMEQLKVSHNEQRRKALESLVKANEDYELLLKKFTKVKASLLEQRGAYEEAKLKDCKVSEYLTFLEVRNGTVRCGVTSCACACHYLE